MGRRRVLAPDIGGIVSATPEPTTITSYPDGPLVVRGEIELICSVDPFATQIRQLNAAKFFAYPYDQAAGKLTNLIVTRSDVIAGKSKGVEETVRAIVKGRARRAAERGLVALEGAALEAAIARLSGGSMRLGFREDGSAEEEPTR